MSDKLSIVKVKKGLDVFSENILITSKLDLKGLD